MMMTLPAIEATRLDSRIPLGMLGNSSSVRELGSTLERHLLDLGQTRNDFEVTQTYHDDKDIRVTVSIRNPQDREQYGEFTIRLGYEEYTARNRLTCARSPAEITGTLNHPVHGKNKILIAHFPDYDLFEEDNLLNILAKFVKQARDQFSEWNKDTLPATILPTTFTTFASPTVVIDFDSNTTSTAPIVESDFVFQADGAETSNITPSSRTTDHSTFIPEQLAREIATQDGNSKPEKVEIFEGATKLGEFSGDEWDTEKRKIRSDYLVTDRIKEYILKKFPNGLQGLEVLDGGCGSGEFAIWLAKQGATVIAFDYSKEQVQKAKAKLAKESEEIQKRVQLFVGDITRLPFLREKRFDIVHTAMMHLYLDEHPFILSFKEIARHLKPGGTGIYANDNPDRYGPALYGIDPYSLDGRNNTQFSNPYPTLTRTLTVKESYLRDDGTTWETEYYIEPIDFVIRCMSKNGLRINDMIRPVPTQEELDSKLEMFIGADKIPPYIIVDYTK